MKQTDLAEIMMSASMHGLYLIAVEDGASTRFQFHRNGAAVSEPRTLRGCVDWLDGYAAACADAGDK